MKTRILIAIALAAAGCKTKNESSDLVITAIVPPTATASVNTVSCSFDPAAKEFTPALPYNPAENTAATVAAVVQNNLIDPTTLNALFRTNSATFLPHQAVITYEYIPTSGGTAPSGQNVVPTSGVTVPAGSTGTVAFAVFQGQTISAAAGTYVRATVHLEGKLLDGSTVHTSEREYLFRVCNTAGCGLGGTWVATPTAAGSLPQSCY